MPLATLLLGALAAPLIQGLPQHQQQGSGTQEITLYTPTYSIANPFFFTHTHTHSHSHPGQQQHNNGTHQFKCKFLGPQCGRLPPGAPKNESISVKVYCVAHHVRVPGDDHKGFKYELRPKMMSPCPWGSECHLERPATKHHHHHHHHHQIPHPRTVPTTNTSSTPADVAVVPDTDIWMWIEDGIHGIPGLRTAASSWVGGLDGFMKKVDGTDEDDARVVTIPGFLHDRGIQPARLPLFNLTCVEKH
ncbi:hypothetical protein HD806DRAFT_552613 [Xylariaceae sp. AK1471]|nr:hypothetical protein HD806DRAFT_552613 [Xylariaceae sp. AK1471]